VRAGDKTANHISRRIKMHCSEVHPVSTHITLVFYRAEERPAELPQTVTVGPLGENFQWIMKFAASIQNENASILSYSVWRGHAFLFAQARTQ
jgi:hypothetical protein